MIQQRLDGKEPARLFITCARRIALVCRALLLLCLPALSHASADLPTKQKLTNSALPKAVKKTDYAPGSSAAPPTAKSSVEEGAAVVASIPDGAEVLAAPGSVEIGGQRWLLVQYAGWIGYVPEAERVE